MKRLTLATAKKEIPEGISLRRKDGEYRVTFDGAELVKRYGLGANAEAFAYYTDDLHDALETARAMIGARKLATGSHAKHERAESASYERTEHAKPKRGPGRPRKVETMSEQEARAEYEAMRDVWGDNHPNTRKAMEAYRNAVPVKRGPGRPRKVAASVEPVAKKRTETPEQVRERMAKVRAARKSGK